MIFNEDWKKIEIDNIGDIITGKTPSTKDEGNFGEKYLFITPRDMNSNKYVFNTERKLSEKGFNSINNNYIEGESVCVSCIGSDMGEVVMTTKKCVTNQQINSITRIKDKYNPEFLYYYLKPLKEYFHNIAGGTTMPILNKTDFSNIKISIPKLSKQKQITNMLSTLDKKIENNKKMNKTLEEMAKSIYKSWFVDFEPFQEEEFVYNEKLKKEIPKSFNVSTIGKELRVELGGTPLRRESKYWENGDINWIKSGKVNEFRITEPSEHITKEGLDNSSTVLLPKGTVVIAITGATLGQVSRLEIESCANQSVVGVVESNEIPSEYIYLWLLHRINVIIQKQTGGAQQHINKTNVKNSLLLLPPQKFMKEFIETIRPIFNKISYNCFENQSLKELRNSLLPKLMSGEIRVPLDEETKEVK